METRLILLSVLIAVATGSGPARADDTTRKFLQGSWAVACDAPVTGTNPLVTFFEVPGNDRLFLLTFTVADKAITPVITEVLTDGPIAGGRAAVRFKHADGVVMTTTLDLSRGDSYAVYESRTPDGTFSTKNGTAVRSGMPSVRYQRCTPR